MGQDKYEQYPNVITNLFHPEPKVNFYRANIDF
jgi:hypothetical protein